MCALANQRKARRGKQRREGRPKPFKNSKITLREIRRVVNADKEAKL